MQGDTSYDTSEEILLVIFTTDRHGQLQVAASSSNLGGEASMYKDGKILSVKKGVISYHHQSMWHHLSLKFRYEINAGEFMLIGKDYADYGSMKDGPTKVSINYLSGVKLTDKSAWDNKTEEIISLPQERKTFKAPLKPLSSINWETLYDDLF